MRHAAIAALLLTALTAAACPAAEARTITLGVSLSLTGELQEAGRKALAGIRLRLDDFNADNDAVKIELAVRDNRSTVDQAVQNVRDLVAINNVAAILGPLSTTMILPMRDAAAELGVVLVSPSVTSPRVGKNRDWACRLLFDDEFQGVALARFLAERQGMMNAAAVLNDRFAYAASVFTAFKKEYERLGGKIVREEHYEWVANQDKDYDFTDILQRVADTHPDIVLLPVYSTEVAAIIRTSTKMRLGLRFCGGDTWQHEIVLLSSGNDLQNAFFISGINFDANTPEMNHYLELFDRSNDEDAQLTSVLGYDALSLLLEALKGGGDRAAIRDRLYTIKNLRLATGVITVDPERGSEKTAYIHRINMHRGEFTSRIIDELAP